MTAPHPALLRLAAGRDAAAPADETEFLRSAAEHRMASVAFAAHERGAISLTRSACTTLATWELAEQRQHLHFWQTIRDAESRLAPLGVHTAVLKGVATEARWYDGLGQRVCTDVDLLLEPDALDRAADVVHALDDARGARAAIQTLVDQGRLQHVDLRVGATSVDLHFDPLKIGIATRQLDEVWHTTELLATAHGTIRVLRPDLELVMLLLHLHKDAFAYLGPFLDVARIVERATLDWPYLQTFVAEEGLDIPVWKSLSTVVDVLGLELDVPPVSGLRARTWDRLWGPGTRLGGDEGRLRAPSIQRFLALHASGRTMASARELKRQLVPPRQLLEVAGRLEPHQSYARYLTIDRFRRDRRRAPVTDGDRREQAPDRP